MKTTTMNDMKKISNLLARYGCKNAKITIEYDCDMNKTTYSLSVMKDWLKWDFINAEHPLVFESEVHRYLRINYKKEPIEVINIPTYHDKAISNRSNPR